MVLEKQNFEFFKTLLTADTNEFPQNISTNLVQPFAQRYSRHIRRSEELCFIDLNVLFFQKRYKNVNELCLKSIFQI